MSTDALTTELEEATNPLLTEQVTTDALSNEQAATKLQALHRGRITRASFAETGGDDELLMDDATAQEEEAAATQDNAPAAEGDAAAPRPKLQRRASGRSVRKSAARVTGMTGFFSGKRGADAAPNAGEEEPKIDEMIANQ